jgi:hypothetical protein
MNQSPWEYILNSALHMVIISSARCSQILIVLCCIHDCDGLDTTKQLISESHEVTSHREFILRNIIQT